MNTLAIDVGTKMGWAVFEDGNLLCYGTQVMKAPQGPARRLEVYNWVRLMVTRHLIEVVAVEQVDFMKQRLAYASYCHNRALLDLCTAQFGLPSHPVPTGTLKKWATGTGKATKSLMISAANERFGLDLPKLEKYADQADAILVGAWSFANRDKIGVQDEKATTRKSSRARAPRVRSVKPSNVGSGARPRSGKRGTRPGS